MFTKCKEVKERKDLLKTKYAAFECISLILNLLLFCNRPVQVGVEPLALLTRRACPDP